MDMNDLNEDERSQIESINLAMNKIDKLYIDSNVADMKQYYMSTIDEVISGNNYSKMVIMMARQGALTRLFMLSIEQGLDIGQCERLYNDIVAIGHMQYHSYISISLIRAQYFSECSQRTQAMNILHDLETSLNENPSKLDHNACHEILERIEMLRSD